MLHPREHFLRDTCGSDHGALRFRKNYLISGRTLAARQFVSLLWIDSSEHCLGFYHGCGLKSTSIKLLFEMASAILLVDFYEKQCIYWTYKTSTGISDFACNGHTYHSGYLPF